jgi:hypothetical protein
MPPSEQDNIVLGRVIEMMATGQPTVQNLDDFLVAYHTLGRLVAIAQGDMETLEQVRKQTFAQAFIDAKRSTDKPTDKMAEYIAELAVGDIRTKEIKSRERLMKLKGMRESVLESIWAIKFLGRQDGWNNAS